MKRICQVCGKEFEVDVWAVKVGYGKFCSKECYWKYRRKRVKRICEVCGKEFEVWECFVKKGGGKFCSKKCEGLGRWKRVRRICQGCGKEFEVWESEFRSDPVAVVDKITRCFYECYWKGDRNMYKEFV